MAHSFASLPESIRIGGTKMEAFKIMPDTFQPPEYIVNLHGEGKTLIEAKQICMTNAKSVEAFLKNFFSRYEINIALSDYKQVLQQKHKEDSQETYLMMIDAYFKIIMPHDNHPDTSKSQKTEEKNKIKIEEMYEKSNIRPHHYRRGLKKLSKRL